MYPKEYIEYLIQFHAQRDYFECHEILEEYWKSKPFKERKKVWVGLIQIAVSLYHHRRNNFSGALKMIKNAIIIIKEEKDEINKLGLNYGILLTILEKEHSLIQDRKPYEGMNLPIADNNLLQQCQDRCHLDELIWCTPSNLDDLELIHRHTRRDRSDVIKERVLQKELKVKKNN